jgi:hypothetical protein
MAMSASLKSTFAVRPRAAPPDRCPLCGGPNHCRLSAPVPDGGACWCLNTEVPEALLARVPPDQRGRACLCPNCVADFVAARKAPTALVLRPDDFYFESGRMIFTAAYLRRRGYCCGNGCRHCPYPERTGGL